MKYTLEIDESEADEFVRIFFNGVSVPYSSASNIEKRLIRKVTAIAQKYEESLSK